jgi:hypothetical protein
MHPVTVQFPAASGQLIGEGGCILWHSSYETSGSSTAQYSLWDGTTNSGNMLMTVTLAAGQSTRDYIHIHHMPFYQGLYWHLDSGATAGNVIVQIAHNCRDHWRLEQQKLEDYYRALAEPLPAPTTAPDAANTAGVGTLFQPGPRAPSR